MSALERIAELHYKRFRRDPRVEPVCGACGVPWPCPTRRLCDEAAREAACADSATDALGVFLRVAVDERAAARADADRLADAVNFAIAHSAGMYPGALDYLRQASAAHDATRAKEGPNGFAIEDLCDADD